MLLQNHLLQVGFQLAIEVLKEFWLHVLVGSFYGHCFTARRSWYFSFDELPAFDISCVIELKKA